MGTDTPKVGDTAVRLCEGCEQVKECTYQPDPFASEIHGDDTPRWQCDWCYQESSNDI